MLFTRFREALAPTDPSIIAVAAGGEKLVAAMRVIFWAAIWMIPLVTVVSMAAPPPEVFISFAAASAALLMSAILMLIVRQYRGSTSVAFLSASFDVTLVSATLAAMAFAGRHEVAVNSLVVWPVYLLAIVATAFRFDYRVCVLAGTLSIAEYGGILAVLSSVEGNEQIVNWPAQVGRMMLQAIAAAVAIGLVHQGRKLARVSGTDRLTGLGNRVLLDEVFTAELNRAARAGSQLSVAFIDIDHFKRFNDTWGHDAGDAALRAVADVLCKSGRASDRAFRWGGEELVLLMPDTGPDGAVAHLDRVRGVLRTTPVLLAPAASITVSAGIATFPEDGRSPAELITAADRRLLLAKQHGRDRVVVQDVVPTVAKAS